MIIKRSWIFAVFMLWIPFTILILSGISIFIAYNSIDIINIKYTLIIGNLIMALILVVSSFNYIFYFRKIHQDSQIRTDIENIRDELAQGDRYFINFFNWSITNQWILIGIMLIEVVLIAFYGQRIGNHFWMLATDTLVILTEIGFLRQYRKRMIDLEMDYNIVVPGKIFFANQSGILSSIQTIEGNKIKAVQSVFPNKIASFFNYGTINILTEGTNIMIGSMIMYYVTNPDEVVTNIQALTDDSVEGPRAIVIDSSEISIPQKTTSVGIISEGDTETLQHSIDTREKIRDVLN